MSDSMQAILDHPDFPQRTAWWREDFGAGQTHHEEICSYARPAPVKTRN